MLLLKTLGLAALISLSACSSLNTELGYMSLKDSSKSSIDTWIIDGQTTKDQISAALGPYQDDDNPAMIERMRCKQEAKVCDYMVNIGSPIHSQTYIKSVMVFYDERNVVKSHRFSHTYGLQGGGFKTEH